MAVVLAVFNRRMSAINRNIYKVGQLYGRARKCTERNACGKGLCEQSHEQQLFEELIQEYRSNKIAFYRTMGTSSSFNYLLMRGNLFQLNRRAYFTVIGDLTAGELVGYILLSNVFVGQLIR